MLPFASWTLYYVVAMLKAGRIGRTEVAGFVHHHTSGVGETVEGIMALATEGGAK